MKPEFRKGRASSSERKSLGRLFSAAAARPEELPAYSPFFLTRLKGRLAEAEAHPGWADSIAAAARQMLPGFLALTIMLSGWMGAEQVRATRARQAALTAAAYSGEAAGELVLAAIYLTAHSSSITPSR